MKIINETKTFAEKYSIEAAEYEKFDIALAEIPNETLYYLTASSDYSITSIADLLKLSPKQLMKFEHIGEASIRKIDLFISEIDINRLLRHKNSIPSIFNLSEYKAKIINGDFSFADKIYMSKYDKEYIEKCKIAYEIIGKDLIKKCCSSFTLMTTTQMLLTNMSYLNSYTKKEEELNNIINLIPIHRRKRQASLYLLTYFGEQEKVTEYLRFYCNDINLSLDRVDKKKLIKDFYCYFYMIKFFKWCSFNLENDIKELYSKIYGQSNIRRIIQLRMNNNSFSVISKKIGWSVKMLKRSVKQAIIKIEKYVSFYKEIKRKICAEYDNGKIVDNKDLSDYISEFDYIYSLSQISDVRFPHSMNEIIVYNRVICGYSIEDLYDKTSIMCDRLNGFENGTILPFQNELEMIAETFEEPIETFNLNRAIREFNIGGKLQYLRCKAGFSIKEVSTRLSISEDIILSYESNNVIPNAVHIQDFSVLYDVPERLLNITSILKESSQNVAIKYYRRTKGISEQELAQKTNINLRRIRKIEKENTKIRQIELMKIADALDLSYKHITHRSMTLGNRIEYIRQINNITIKKLSELSELNTTMINSYEKDKCVASISDYIAISQALDVPLEKLYPTNQRNIADMSLGKYVNYYRILQGYSIKQFSIITGLKEEYITMIESGQREPNNKEMEKIAKAIKKSPLYFISRFSQ